MGGLFTLILTESNEKGQRLNVVLF